ncbi:bifunctional 4-hydroxy-2-oxoglutarate aldolase/2-dehydro-3-deoxy-phosphogluconate aldolase [Flavobacterium denitrificans]|uniref:bifunctional 4-hydroxy-2-oxoglutarate aldolase/2-dehydro-3-deoxy-phosphogluconate aldolase n=1 Tax=Flavobacterium denitrificans TaxID=281361 RepID=UPI00040B515A|nr:ketohydroxyglutarate aldolase [Flavobacterium denitrificans]
MKSIQNAIEIIANQGVLPLYFNTDEMISIEVLRALYKAGIRAVEYTNRGSEALSNFKKMVEVRNAEMPAMLLGIGTIKNELLAKDFHLAGADFFISPGFVPEVASFLKSNNLLYAPGCMTPTEIIAAENAGVSFIKLFPGNILGPDFMSSIKEVFPNLTFMVTGGVDTTHASIQSWFTAGVAAVGLGSKLITKKRMIEEDYATIEKETRTVLDIIQTTRKQL